MNLDTEGRNVLLLELSGQMALDEGGLQGEVVSFFSRCRLAGSLFAMLPGAGLSLRKAISLEHAKAKTHLSCTAVTDKDELEGGHVAACFSHGCGLLWWGMCDVMRKIWSRRNVSGGG